MIYWILKYTLGILIRFIWVRRVTGISNIPKKGAFIICANHSSYFDFLTLIAVCPRRIHFLAGEVFFEKWQWRWLVRSTDQIKVDRRSKDKSESIHKATEYLKKGMVVGIFPEGTRSNDGKLGKFYNGAIKIAKEINVPILPVGINGTFEIMSRFDKYPNFDKKCILNFGSLERYSNNIFVGDNLLDKFSNELRKKINNLINIV
ncbi:MAG: lysophospholipid acyltransferase family protein [Patescibacteria group bacterium]|nr:lysophospholipid acyltransferase family protein [Patescibacteria group bacterium]MDD4304590.1 lysophospholipid acyltransferase family protein [Patescibacteria group bacterium]MDD4695625.1 lysophospholipid acyltransferase family protein [Patescibacteria group bacterium]